MDISERWQEIVIDLIDDINDQGCRYKWDPSISHGGCTEDVLWGDSVIIAAGKPPDVYCSGVLMEVIAKAFAYAGKEQELSILEMRKLKSWVFVHDAEKQRRGAPQGLVEMGVAEWVDPENAALGDILQIEWDLNRPGVGHCAIVVDADEKGVTYWSATSILSGTGAYRRDFRPMRRFNVARIKKEWFERFI